MNPENALLAEQLRNLAEQASRRNRPATETGEAIGYAVRTAVRRGLLDDIPGVADALRRAELVQEELLEEEGDEFPDPVACGNLAAWGFWREVVSIVAGKYPGTWQVREAPEEMRLVSAQPNPRSSAMIEDITDQEVTICRWLADKIAMAKNTDDSQPLDTIHRNILRVLARQRVGSEAALNQGQIAAQAHHCDRKIRDALKELRQRGFVSPPAGSRKKGTVITPTGRAFLAATDAPRG